MFEIKSAIYDDLTEEEKEDQPDNGNGKEYASYLIIQYYGKTISIHSDAMEPEDCTFGRDLRWVEGAIRSAYELGGLDS